MFEIPEGGDEAMMHLIQKTLVEPGKDRFTIGFTIMQVDDIGIITSFSNNTNSNNNNNNNNNNNKDNNNNNNNNNKLLTISFNNLIISKVNN